MIKYVALILTLASFLKGECTTLADKKCLGCVTGDTCAWCYESYWNATTKACTAPTTEIDDCVNYKDATTCAVCDEEYRLSGNACVEVTPDDCISVKSTDVSKCQVCDSGKRGDFTTGVCGDTDCTSTNCKYCTMTSATTEVCSRCDDDYNLTSTGTCVNTVANCAVLDTNNKCIQCDFGYYMNKTACESSDETGSNGIMATLSLLVFVFLAFL